MSVTHAAHSDPITATNYDAAHVADIVNADVNAAAAIAQSKIANLVTDLAAKATPADITTAIAAKVAKAGDTMTGPLVLSGAPTLANHAATKAYADSLVIGGGGVDGLLYVDDYAGADDDAKWAACIADMPANGAWIVAPLRAQTLAARIVIADKPVKITGALGVSNMTFTTAGNRGFQITQNDSRKHVHIEGLSLYSDVAYDAVDTTEYGILISFADAYGVGGFYTRNPQQVVLKHVTIKGTDTAEGWRRHFGFEDCSAVNLGNLVVEGIVGPSYATTPWVAFQHSVHAYHIMGANIPVVLNARDIAAYYCAVAFQNGGEQFEGVQIAQANFVACGMGVYVNFPGLTGTCTQFGLVDSHVSVYQEGVYLSHVSSGWVKDCEVYRRVDADPTYVTTGIITYDCHKVRIKGNRLFNNLAGDSNMNGITVHASGTTANAMGGQNRFNRVEFNDIIGNPDAASGFASCIYLVNANVIAPYVQGNVTKDYVTAGIVNNASAAVIKRNLNNAGAEVDNAY